MFINQLLILIGMGVIIWRQIKNMATLEERFNAVNAKLEEAAGEILAEIEKLREGTLNPEQEAALENIEAKANALADIAPPLG